MKIKKINEDKLKIILNSNDLDAKNIDIDSFLANPIESQNLFFEILDLAEEQFNFEIANNKAIIETISLDNNIFVLTITKLKTDMGKYNNTFTAYCFETVNDWFNFYSIIKNNNIKLDNFELYQFLDKYYFILDKENIYIDSVLKEFSYPTQSFCFLKDVLTEYGKKIEKTN